MKKLLFTLGMISLIVVSYSQAPQAFNYQAILRNPDGTIKANESVVIHINIINDQRVSSYFEMHEAQTNELGLVNVVIGQGTTGDNLALVDWANGPFFLDITVNGEAMGSSPLLSVPYALYAATGPHGGGDTKWNDVDGGISYSEGRVGIGTDSPQSGTHLHSQFEPGYGQLIISAPSGQHIQYSFLEDDDVKAYMWWDPTQGDLRLQNETRGDLGLNPYGGNVGIGTVDPSERLDVNGNLKVDGDIILNGMNLQDLLDELAMIIDMAGFGLVTDIDGNVYKTVKIGDQVWMAENLKTTKYKDGAAITLVTDNTAWSILTTPGYCWYKNDSTTYANPYGAIYNYYTVNTGNLCPTGWHVPTDTEWTTMENYLIGNGYNYDGTTSGSKIAKSLASTALWKSSSSIGAVGNTNYPAYRNKTGFTALPGGSRFIDGICTDLGDNGMWWSSTEETSTTTVYFRSLSYNSSSVVRSSYYMQSGFSVRCVRD